MNGKTHRVGGVCAGVITTAVMLQPPYTFSKLFLSGIIIWGSTAGSFIPDIDHKGSTIGKKHKITSFAISNLFGHRGMAHAPLIYSLLYFLALTLGETIPGYLQLMYVSLITGIFIGVLSHIFLDSLTVDGTPWLYPFTKKKFSIIKLKIKSKKKKKSKVEKKVEFIMILLTAFIAGIALF